MVHCAMHGASLAVGYCVNEHNGQNAHHHKDQQAQCHAWQSPSAYMRQASGAQDRSLQRFYSGFTRELAVSYLYMWLAALQKLCQAASCYGLGS